jgi:HSP20 family protein
MIMATRYPISTITGVRQAMDRIVNDAFGPSQFATIWPSNVSERGNSAFPIDAYATDNEFVILAAAPGISSEDLQITVEKNTLTLSATIPSVAKSDHAKGATWYLHELPSGSFQRSLTLPMDVDSSKAEATFENGVLRLTLPKAEASRARQIHVQGPAQEQDMPEISGTASAEVTESAE